MIKPAFLPIMQGAVTLAEILAENLQIQRLDVRHNQVLAGGLMALSLALRINHSLIRLDLDQHLKEEKVSSHHFILIMCHSYSSYKNHQLNVTVSSTS